MVPSAGPHQGGPVPARSAMVVEQDYHRVNRCPAATAPTVDSLDTPRRKSGSTARASRTAGFGRRGGLSPGRPAVPLEPFRSGPAHVVQLRPIAIYKATDDSLNERQDMHSRAPPTRPSTRPLASLLAPTLDDWREVVRPQYEMRRAAIGCKARNCSGCPAVGHERPPAHAALDVGETSFTAPFQPLSVISNTMPSGVVRHIHDAVSLTRELDIRKPIEPLVCTRRSCACCYEPAQNCGVRETLRSCSTPRQRQKAGRHNDRGRADAEEPARCGGLREEDY
jgi:hypothetical protein